VSLVRAGGLRLDAHPLHDREIVLDVGAFVQVNGTVELLEVDDVGEVWLGEPQDRERAACRGVTAETER